MKVAFITIIICVGITVSLLGSLTWFVAFMSSSECEHKWKGLYPYRFDVYSGCMITVDGKTFSDAHYWIKSEGPK